MNQAALLEIFSDGNRDVFSGESCYIFFLVKQNMWVRVKNIESRPASSTEMMFVGPNGLPRVQ